nr:hypothetical protein 5 - Synechococcus sp. (PCC 6716) [Synechococcus sp.]CAA49881.1 unnamed protein product [Synechococcus sp.]
MPVEVMTHLEFGNGERGPKVYQRHHASARNVLSTTKPVVRGTAKPYEAYRPEWRLCRSKIPKIRE